MTISSFAKNIGDIKQNLIQKLKIGVIELKDAEKMLDVLEFKLIV